MKQKTAFTLIEIMIVLTIVGILASLGTVNYIRVKRMAEYKGALCIMRSLAAAVKNYCLSTDKYAPTVSTSETNSIYGVKITDARCAFHNYTVLNITGPSFCMRMDYAAGDGSGTHSANYSFDKNSVQTGCTGADCLP